MNPSEIELQVHIHEILQDYVTKHCTVDYLAWTEDFVCDFLCSLEQVPLYDSYTILRPQEPLKVLAKIYNLEALEPYDETIASSRPVREYLTSLVAASSVRGRSSPSLRVIRNDKYGPPEPDAPLDCVLTRRARKEAPAFGRLRPKVVPKDIIRNFEPFDIEEPVDEVVPMDEVLKVNPLDQIPEELLLQSEALLRKVIRPEIRKGGGLSGGLPNRYLDPDYLHNSSEIHHYGQEEEFLPLFPRVPRSTPKGTLCADPLPLATFPELARAIEPSFEVEPEPELHQQNLVIVDGWEAMVSSPSSFSQDSDSEDQLCDARWPTSPPTEPNLAQEIEDLQMDVLEMPQSLKRGGHAGVSQNILSSKTFQQFIQESLSGPLPYEKRKTAEARSMPGSLLSPTFQAEFQDLTDVESIYAHISNEKLPWMDDVFDQKDSMLMEVPDLPPPTTRPNDPIFMPKTLRQMLAPLIKEGQSGHAVPPYAFLKKVKGLQSLAVALSWVTFTTDEQLPGVTEIVDIKSPVDERSGVNMDAVQALLSSVTLDDHQDSCTHPWLVPIPLSAPPAAEEGFRVMTTRAERLRALGIPTKPMSPGDGEGTELDIDDLDDLDSEGQSRGGKRFRLASPEPESMEVLDLDLDLPDPFAFVPDPDEDKENIDPSSSAGSLFSDPEWGAALFIGDPAKVREGRSSTPSRESPAKTLDYPAPSANLTDLQLPSDPRYKNGTGNSDTIWAGNIHTFTQLRGKKVSAHTNDPVPVSIPVVVTPMPAPKDTSPAEPKGAIQTPEELFNDNTLRIPTEIVLPTSTHTYLASLSFLQKHALVSVLRSPECSIELMEKESLDGVDLIVDARHAVVFVSLFLLPSQSSAFLDLISEVSWRFERILVVFEGYTAECARRRAWGASARGGGVEGGDGGHLRGRGRPSLSQLDPYTPPIMKAVKKFRRDLEIASACGSQSRDTVVWYGYANVVEEAALLTRCYGDLVQAADGTEGVIWGDRQWLEWEGVEGEGDELASVPVMNRFATSFILSQMSLQEFLDLSADQRAETFAPYLGEIIIVEFNLLDKKLAHFFFLCGAFQARFNAHLEEQTRQLQATMSSTPTFCSDDLRFPDRIQD